MSSVNEQISMAMNANASFICSGSGSCAGSCSGSGSFCSQFDNVVARLGIFTSSIVGPDYNLQYNTVLRSTVFGDVIAYSTISAKVGIFSSIQYVTDISNYAISSQIVTDTNFTTLYDTFVCDNSYFQQLDISNNYDVNRTTCNDVPVGATGPQGPTGPKGAPGEFITTIVHNSGATIISPTSIVLNDTGGLIQAEEAFSLTVNGVFLVIRNPPGNPIVIPADGDIVRIGLFSFPAIASCVFEFRNVGGVQSATLFIDDVSTGFTLTSYGFDLVLYLDGINLYVTVDGIVLYQVPFARDSSYTFSYSAKAINLAPTSSVAFENVKFFPSGLAGAPGQISNAIASTITTAGSQITVDWQQGDTWYVSSMTANFSTLFTNMPVSTNQHYTATFFLKQQTAGHYIRGIGINDTAVPLKWLNGTNPTPTSTGYAIQTIQLANIAFQWVALSEYKSFP